MDPSRRDLKLVVCVLSEATRRKFLKSLVELAAKGELATEIPRFQFELVRCPSQQQAIDYLRQKAGKAANCDFVLLSDALAESGFGVSDTDSWMPTQWAKEVYQEVHGNLATIAIMDNPRRVRDVDRSLSSRAGHEQLLDVLKLVADKLWYIARPEKRTRTYRVDVRPIRRQTEMMEYFKLRHCVYKIMGYLEEEFENAPSKLEINWCDTISLHFGAFASRGEGREELAGTARVVIGSSQGAQRYASMLAQYKEWTTKLANQDPVLRNGLANRVLELELPIFHSQKLGEIFRQSVLRNEVCGELSRVIVAPDYRGIGLSGDLVKYALAEAARAGVNRTFLECLDIHEELYKSFGFARLEGTRGTVLGVNRTMIAMELHAAVPAQSPPSSSAQTAAEKPTHV